MRVAALVPTCNRAGTAARAVETFIRALATAEASSLKIIVADDSTNVEERSMLADLLASIGARHPECPIVLIPANKERPSPPIPEIGRGPGATRNRGLRHLRRRPRDHDVLLLFDDDMCFSDLLYRDVDFACRGDLLLREALASCRQPRSVTGCRYIGRQDLSILEHARLDEGQSGSSILPSLERQDVENVAPGGVSTAFLAVSAAAHDLPDFPEHYNEDYVWLHALGQAGWPLRKLDLTLIHAPPGTVEITFESLSFQIFGEIVWLAVLERDRYPASDGQAMAAAIDEIVGDLRQALHQPSVIARPAIALIIRKVIARYELFRQEILPGPIGRHGTALLNAIRSALSLSTHRRRQAGTRAHSQS